MGEPLYDALRSLGETVLVTKALNGWDVTDEAAWGAKYQIPGDLCLIHSEVSEALEAFRKGDRENFAGEMADVLIRLVGLCHGLGIDLAGATLAKVEANRTRGFHHDGKTI